MSDDLERVLQGLRDAQEFAKSYRFQMTDDYLALIEQVEALPENQAAADKSWVARLLEWSAQHYARASRAR